MKVNLDQEMQSVYVGSDKTESLWHVDVRLSNNLD